MAQRIAKRLPAPRESRIATRRLRTRRLLRTGALLGVAAAVAIIASSNRRAR